MRNHRPGGGWFVLSSSPYTQCECVYGKRSWAPVSQDAVTLISIFHTVACDLSRRVFGCVCGVSALGACLFLSKPPTKSHTHVGSSLGWTGMQRAKQFKSVLSNSRYSSLVVVAGWCCPRTRPRVAVCRADWQAGAVAWLND